MLPNGLTTLRSTLGRLQRVDLGGLAAFRLDMGSKVAAAVEPLLGGVRVAATELRSSNVRTRSQPSHFSTTGCISIPFTSTPCSVLTAPTRVFSSLMITSCAPERDFLRKKRILLSISAEMSRPVHVFRRQVRLRKCRAPCETTRDPACSAPKARLPFSAVLGNVAQADFTFSRGQPCPRPPSPIAMPTPPPNP